MQVTNQTDSNQFKASLFLYGALPQSTITNIVRAQCIPEETERIPEIISGWRRSVNRFREIESLEQGIADNNQPKKITSHPKLQEIQNDALFRNSFSVYPSDFKIVDIDKLVATQRHVSLPYIDELVKRIPADPSIDDLIDICISPNQSVPSPKIYQNAENLLTFSSPSVDFRFLGGFTKKLTPDDISYCLGGGLPVEAVILFVGYGSGSINVLRANNRLILNNGFHRVYTLRKMGIKKIPVVVQNIGNPDLEMAHAILGLSKDYLLKHPRPVLVKDFFTEELTTVLRMKNTIRSVRVQWGIDQGDMAI